MPCLLQQILPRPVRVSLKPWVNLLSRSHPSPPVSAHPTGELHLFLHASQTHTLSNGVMGLQHNGEPHIDGVNGMAEPLSSSNGASELLFDSVEDTIGAFSTLCPSPSLPSAHLRIYKNESRKLTGPPSIEEGNFIIVLDSTARENEGDLIIAAEHMTPEKMAFMVQHTSGLVCVPVSSSITRNLKLPQMVPEDQATEMEGTAYTVSVDAVGTTTGISTYDRALTCSSLASVSCRVESLRRPGHVFPLRARDGGVRERRGHTEATIEFCKLAGKRPVGVLSELVDVGREVDGKAERKGAGMLRRDDCLTFGKSWGIRVCTIDQLVEFVER